MTKGPRPKTLVERIRDKFLIGDGCWEWTASLNNNGYGRVTHQHRTVLAHRAVYEWLVGPIPSGLDLDHGCRNHRCVRPDHLEPVTRSVNLKRGVGVGGWRPRRIALQGEAA